LNGNVGGKRMYQVVRVVRVGWDGMRPYSKEKVDNVWGAFAIFAVLKKKVSFFGILWCGVWLGVEECGWMWCSVSCVWVCVEV
jgi:hypothetical protein